jgi:hypothetical protein
MNERSSHRHGRDVWALIGLTHQADYGAMMGCGHEPPETGAFHDALERADEDA